ncbi:MAG: hypothetical protein QM529_04680, partial [Hydrotalea sp.]|nr:hypothetical protein [Hydrotalea sp.]
MDKKTISALLDWFYHNARNQPDAPYQLSWRKIKSSQDPWAALVSEVMLQQTTVATIAKRFPIFMAQFPTPQKMVAGGITAVLDAWAGLGYYRRAHNLFAAAQMVTNQWHGVWPRTAPEIKKLPGVGDYTARAIAALSFQQKTIPLDGNIIRVLSRFLKKDLSQTTAPTIKKLLASPPLNIDAVGQNPLPSSNEVVGRTILPSSNEVIGRTILPSSNEVVGRTILPSSNEVIGR